ncbi:TlpA family protein disulfide reductase [Pedobacter polaris]|uniref:TlpA family protein disulfide reductase n=1 Tax=Pedobacter polaris TaxID=2571273 RepID=A0A4U1CJQ3_9SPHI|nr:TlpA disulfide reductase family protein [Pedobacter polaris]TKC05583.1 TlpA family protein disulfide reductase [Pedobacter polaris]
MMQAHRIFSLTLVLLFTIITYGYGDIVVKFKLPSAKNLAYRIISNPSVFNDYKGIILSTGKLDSVGEFTTSLKLDKEKEVVLFVGNQYYNLWFGENGSFNMVEDQHTLKFAGAYASENEVLYQTKLMQPYTLPGYMAFTKAQVENHSKMLDSLEQHRMAVLGDYRNKLSPSFYIQTIQEVINFSLYKKSQFVMIYDMKSTELPVNYYDFWKRFKVLPDGVISKNYLGAIGDYTQFLVKEKFSNTNVDRVTAIKTQFKLMDSLFFDKPKTLEVVQGELILFYIQYMDEVAMISALKSNYETKYPNSPYTELLEAKWLKKNEQYLKKPTFSLKNTKGESVSIESFKGNVVYIDFWGSWCKACLIEMPYAKMLRDKFKNEKVIFLYLDFYDTKDLWIKAIKAHEITGVNLKAEAADEKYFNEFFGIKNGFPRYAVLDRNGFLISTAAPSPSNDGVVDYLKRILQQ